MSDNSYDEQITVLLNHWSDVKEELKKRFANRELNLTLEPMEEGIQLFYKFLFWANNRDYVSKDEQDIKILKWKPVNVIERLNFINAKPILYHSFIQLTELITEQEKLFNKKKAIEKVTK